MTPRKSLVAVLVAAIAAVAPSWATAQQEIKVGGIFDLTGVTSDVGKPFAQGVQDCVAVTNDAGGIGGKKIKLIGADYAYKIDQARALYKKLVNDDKVVMIQGWGTGDTEALKNIYGEIDALEKTISEGRKYTSYREFFEYALLPGLAIVLLQVVLVSTRFRTLP